MQRLSKSGANLATAHRLYRESERMIANRAAQLSEMLKASGVEEDADDVLADLAAVAGEIGQTEGFGAVAQMYHNLRSSGVGRAEALAALKTRYGPRGTLLRMTQPNTSKHHAYAFCRPRSRLRRERPLV